MKHILVETQIKGYFKTQEGLFKNKFTRNFGRIIDGLIRDENVSGIDTGGSSFTINTGSGGLVRSISTIYPQGVTLFTAYGTGASPPAITDTNIVLDTIIPTSIIDIIETPEETSIVVGGRYTVPTAKTFAEMGLFLQVDRRCLLARSLVSATKTPFVTYLEGYQLSFPATFTRWFVRALYSAMVGHYSAQGHALVARAVDGSYYVLNSGDTFRGALDIMIGKDNSPASPEHYNLLSPITSLANQIQIVEEDTAVQEIRIIRQGTYSPTTEVTLGEVGLFADLYGFRDTTGANRRTLLVRVPIDPPITLTPGTTYTIGIVIRLS